MSTSNLRRRIPSAKVPSQRFHSNRSLKKSDRGGSQPNYSTRAGLTGVCVSREEADAILNELANHDEDAKKTWSRVFVEKVLSKYNWYWPRRNDPSAPQLKKAWTYYEHVTLPRHFTGEGAADTVMRRAEPGEHEGETELYDPLNLQQKDLIEWGTGIDLYFISLRFFAVIMLIAGFINISSIRYYAVGDYNGGPGRALPLQGSAVCTNTAWVVCEDCEREQWSRDKARFAEWKDAEEELTFVQRNLCEGAEFSNGITNFATLLFILVCVAAFSFYLRLREIRFDEDRVTTTDYSVVVKNPPPDALDPDDWRDFFSQFATDGDQVTAVTVALNNEVLVRKLLTRRIFSNQLRSKLPEDVDLEDETAVEVAVAKYNEDSEQEETGCIGRILECCVVPILNIFNMLLPPDKLVPKIAALTEEIKTLQDEEYDATEVYVTFETEEGQRTALDALKVGLLDRLFDRSHAVAPECLFNGKVLQLEEPTEPNTVRWLDLSYGFISRLIRRLIALALTVGLICIAGFCVSKARAGPGPWLSAPLTTIFNSTIPQIIKILMMIEAHATEGGYQASLYLKITLFRWTLSAILTQIITPVTATLGGEKTDLLPTIYAILLSEVWLSPVLRLSDWFTNIKKHILGPRAKTQQEMNLSFQGTYYNLGERYTDFTKVLFVVFFYSALFPLGFFFGFLILALQYLTDKFSLVRIWGWNPLIGSELAEFSRRFFFTGATIAFAVVSSYAWAQFPYDNVCDPSDPQSGFNRTYPNVTDGSGESIGTINVTQSESVVFCKQSWRGYRGFSFPATPRLQDGNDVEWMTDSQNDLTMLYGWFSVFVVCLFAVALFGRATYSSVVSIFIGTYMPEGESQHIDFSSNPEIFAYVPQIKLIGQPFPYLVCDIDDIDQGLIGWNDASHSYDYYNLIFDIPHKTLRRTKIIEGNTRGTSTIAQQGGYKDDGSPVQVPSVGNIPSQAGFEVDRSAALERPIYSLIRHYPTKWQLKMARNEALES